VRQGTRLRIFGFKLWSINHEQKSFSWRPSLSSRASPSPRLSRKGPALSRNRNAARPNLCAAVPVSKIAVIFSEEFQDPKAGIARFATTLRKLNGEFRRSTKKLDDMAVRIKQLPTR